MDERQHVSLLVSGSTFNNLASGNFTASSAGLLQLFASGLTNVFNNAGTYTKAGAGTNRFTTFFNNSGTTTISAGRLDLSGGGTDSGSFSGAGTLEFGGGDHRLLGGASVAITNLVVSGGTVTNLGSFVVAGSTLVSGGTTEFTPPGTLNGLGSAVTITSGTLNLNSAEPVNVSTFNESGGTLGGTDTVTISGPATWTGGSMDGPRTDVANGGLLINPVNGGNVQMRNGRVLNNGGATTWTNGNTFLYLVSGSTFNNLAAATSQLRALDCCKCSRRAAWMSSTTRALTAKAGRGRIVSPRFSTTTAR
jgi:hypothetical protein